MIVDWQHHISPKAIFDMRGGVPGLPVMKDGMVSVHLNEKVYMTELHLEYMQNSGIDVSVLSATLEDLEQCRITNDHYARLKQDHPGKFVCLSPLDPTHEGALEELRRAIEELKLDGAVISPQNSGENLDSPKLWPFYEMMSDFGLPIFIHISAAPRGYDAFDANYNMNIILTREVDVANNTLRLVLGGVMRAFPDLKFVIAHLGGGISSVLDRIERYVKVRKEKLWTDCGGVPPFGEPYLENFREDFDKLYFDLAGYEGGMSSVKSALLSIKPERLVFGTDYPYNFQTDGDATKKYIKDIRNLDLTDEQIGGILGRTAAGLLGLEMS